MAGENLNINRKPLFEQMPNEKASVEEWQDWALRVRTWAYKMAKDEQKRRKKLKKLRKELTVKNRVFEHYKRKIELYETSTFVDIAMCIERLFKGKKNKNKIQPR